MNLLTAYLLATPIIVGCVLIGCRIDEWWERRRQRRQMELLDQRSRLAFERARQSTSSNGVRS